MVQCARDPSPHHTSTDVPVDPLRAWSLGAPILGPPITLVTRRHNHLPQPVRRDACANQLLAQRIELGLEPGRRGVVRRSGREDGPRAVPLPHCLKACARSTAAFRCRVRLLLGGRVESSAARAAAGSFMSSRSDPTARRRTVVSLLPGPHPLQLRNDRAHRRQG